MSRVTCCNVIFEHLPRAAALTSAAVCKEWRKVATSDVLWRKFAADLWATKVYVPQHFRNMVSEPNQARSAYFGALKDAKRTAITKDELCSFVWSFRFKRSAGKAWTSSDPYWSGHLARKVAFQSDHTIKWSRAHDSDDDDGWHLLNMAWGFVSPPLDAGSRRRCRHLDLRRLVLGHRGWLAVGSAAGAKADGENQAPVDGQCEGCALVVQHGQSRCYPSELVVRHADSWGFLLNSAWVLYASFPLCKESDHASLSDKRLNKLVQPWQWDEANEYNGSSDSEEEEEEEEEEDDGASGAGL